MASGCRTAELQIRFACVQELKAEIKKLQDKLDILEAEKQEVALTHEGDAAKLKGLQVNFC